ncbi:MAG: hypothetical protein H0X26_10580 [Alphaproteobacteria bacterium]|nr:hypothetical protein [Alphaproteobacteria bacterium]
MEKDKERFLANTPNENPQIIGWDSDGSSIIVADNYHTTTALYSLPVDGGVPLRLPLGKISHFHFPQLNETGTYIGFVGESSSLPPEVYMSSLKAFKPTHYPSLF